MKKLIVIVLLLITSFAQAADETIVKINGDKYIIYADHERYYWVEIDGQTEIAYTRVELLNLIKSRYKVIEKCKVKEVLPFRFY